MAGLFGKEKQAKENIENKENKEQIVWSAFDTFVKFETGVPKRLKLTNWRQGNWFNMPGLRFDVLEEDSVPKNKIFSTTSKRLIRALKPIILKAEAQGKQVISVSITRIGEGLNTIYEVKENGSNGSKNLSA